jgi:hypothetical protein
MTASAVSSNVLVRLERLERENRRLRLSAAACGLLLFAWTACSVSSQVENQVAAERFVLLGPDGSEKATLEIDTKGNPMLALRNGQASALLTANGPSLLLRGPDGKTGAFMGIDTKNASRVELTSSRLMDGLRLVTHEDGTSGVYALDKEGRARLGLEAFAIGGAGLHLRDPQGVVRSQVAIDPADQPSVILADGNGQRRIGLLVSAEHGQPALELADELGRTRAELTTLFDGTPRFELKREDGGVSFEAP